MSKQKEFEQLLTMTNRKGMDDLINWIRQTDFYTAPASTRFHGAYEGGLLDHSLNVFRCLSLKKKEEIWSEPLKYVQRDSIVIVALLHDLCKANYYSVDYRNQKINDVWEKVPYYTVNDTEPYGHGEKSVMLIEQFIVLTAEERYAIRWHMGAYEPKELWNTLGLAMEKYPLVLATHEADMQATYILETK